MKLRLTLLGALGALVLASGHTGLPAQTKKKVVIPHGQSAPPGPALTPAEAMKKMTLPPGFHVELIAAEPALVNPVAMTFDDKGRIWITESLEYPRRAAGPGKDRIKVLESTKGDGRYDKITIVADGLNIPSGIAVGHGGVWVANSPDILFYPLEDWAAPKLGKPQVVVTGFGRTDTHELPNSLTWGPDGWLYGLNGVFNHSHVKYRGKEYTFTCTLFRIHPRTKDFELFCEGTSNPWGLALDGEGSFFVSACVIDHLWHLVQSGYYHRQGGPYPPWTWKIGSIVKHRHQKAAYCGLVWFDSDAYPEEYRRKLYMGNIHGNCVNSDELSRDGSTYFARPRPDFLSANDAWFMPVAQKIGPDGCLYVLDWYDRYHCYQDANRDPAGIDRLKGRLYRIVHNEYKAPGHIDLRKESDEQLIDRLGHPNVSFREMAQRLLIERLFASTETYPKTAARLETLALSQKAPRTQRLHAWWVIASTGAGKIDHWEKMLRHEDPTFRAWAVRMAGHLEFCRGHHEKAAALAKDPAPDVQLQVAIAARKFFNVDPLPVLCDVLTHCGDDKLIPHIVWQNLHPLLARDGDRFLALAARADLAQAPGLARLLPRAIDRILDNPSGNPAAVVKFLDRLTAKKPDDTIAKLCLYSLALKIRNGEMPGKQQAGLKRDLLPNLRGMIEKRSPLYLEAGVLAAALGDSAGRDALRRLFAATEQSEATLLTALEALTAAGDASVLDRVGAALADPKTFTPAGRARMLAALSRLREPQVAVVVLRAYPKMEPELQPRAIELLTERPAWARALFEQIAAKKVSRDVINVNQARRLLATKDAGLRKLVESHWGVPRVGRNPEREKVVAQMRALLRKTPGDPRRGVPIFKKLCGQCHKIHGEGADVGPDITGNGRSDFEQLLSNVFDPSLVIGAGYQATTVTTTKGQLFTGLVVEDGAQRIVLKVQGGERKVIARGDVEQVTVSPVSLMPEDVERQLRPQEIADLFAYLCLDRPPSDPKARTIPGTPR